MTLDRLNGGPQPLPAPNQGASHHQKITIPCPVCEGQSSFMASHPEAELYRCSLCTHAFSDLASMKSLERYETSYFEEWGRRWFRYPNLKLFDRIAEAIPEKPSSCSVLDVGCGRGDFLRYLRRRRQDLSLTGVDLFPNAPEDGITFLQGEIMRQALQTGFDVVVALAIIEHIPNVKAFVTRLRELSQPSGLLVLMTVNESSLLYGLARALRSIGLTTAFNRLYSKHHVHHFTPRSLERLLASQGIEVKQRMLHNAPLAAIDIPVSNPLAEAALRAVMWGICLAGDLTGTSYLQTVICATPADG